MGRRIECARISEEPLLVLLTLGLVTLVIAISGMRGALSVALVIGLPADIRYRHELIDTLFGVVFVTLVAQGLCIGPLISRLKLAPD